MNFLDKAVGAEWPDPARSGPGLLEQTAAAVRAGRLDPVELTEHALAQAARTAELNAVVHVDSAGALKAARDHDRTGALAGIPVLVKEIIEVEGLPFRCGSLAFEDRVGVRDAEIVRRLRSAGAVIIGLSHSHEFAYGGTGTSNRVGPSRNPRDPSRMTGGSSGGSAAAVAAGVVPLALGTDTAGSVRVPAALCGVVGVKPARGTLPVDGVFPFSESLDHVGVFTTSAADARYAVEVLSGVHSSLAETPGPLRLGLVTNPEPLDGAAEVTEAYARAIDLLVGEGATTVPVRMPDWTHVTATALDVQGPEAAAVHAAFVKDLYQPDVQERLRVSAETPGWRYVLARAEAGVVTAAVADALDGLDAILLPTVPIAAPLLDASDVPGGMDGARERLLRGTRPANLTGHPAVSLPIPTGGALPVGLQIIAADNARMWRAAEWIERALSTDR